MIEKQNVILFANKYLKFAVMVFVLCFISHLPIFSQNIDGTYMNGKEKITINGSQIEYDLIAWGCCIHSIFRGTGTYKISNNRLFIEPDSINLLQKSTIEKKEPLNSDTMIIYNIASHDFPFFVNFFYKNAQTYFIDSDTNGIAKVPRNKVCNSDSIEICCFFMLKSVGTRMTNLCYYDFNVNLECSTEDDDHYDFITNEGKGIKIKIHSDKIFLKYNRLMKRHSKRQKFAWHRFNKINV